MQHPALRYFAAVAQNGSFREAADTLHIAQSALSRQVLRLEEELGMPLLERHARGVTLTQAGELFLRYARDIVLQGEQLRTDLDALRGLRRGIVRVETIEALVPEFLPPIVQHFAERYPAVRLDINVSSTDRVIEAVRDLSVDIGLAFHPAVGHDIAVSARQRAPLLAVMAPNHPLAKQPKIALAEAFAFPLALTTSKTGSRLLIDQAAKSGGLYAVPALESNSTQLLLSFVRQSQAITFLPHLSAATLLRAGLVAAVRIKERQMNAATIDVLTVASRKLSPAADELLRLIRSADAQCDPAATA